MSDRCNVCDKVTETEYRRATVGYVMWICVECGADKKDDPKAPV